MHLSRKQSIGLTISALVLFFLISIVLSRKEDESIIPQESERKSSNTEGNVEKDFSHLLLKDFKRSQSSPDGKTSWSVTAKEGEYIFQQSSAELKDAIVTVSRANGRSFVLRSKNASIIFDGNSLKSATLKNSVELTHEDPRLDIKTEIAEYSGDENTITAPGKVTILSDSIEIYGNSMKANVESQEFELEHGVNSIIKQKSNPS